MLRTVKISARVLVLIAAFVTLQAHSYGTVGHAMQQLRLLASSLIQPVLARRALTVRVPALPYVVLDNESQALKLQLDVLVAEGLILREPVVAEKRELTGNGWVTRMTSGVQYLPLPGKRARDISYGTASLVRVGEISLDPRKDGKTRAHVSFEWQVDELAEWVWAPVFDDYERLKLAKNSQQTAISGTALLEWNSDDQRWFLVELQPF